jgi:hypothetical protein
MDDDYGTDPWWLALEILRAGVPVSGKARIFFILPLTRYISDIS